MAFTMFLMGTLIFSSIPMLVVFKDGKAVVKSVGYRPKAEIAAMVESAK